MIPQRVNSVNELYQDKTLYSSPDMFSPPSERLEHVIRFELTQGCSWKKCTFCKGYDGLKHTIKDLDEYKNHVDAIWERIGEKSPLATKLTRIFIGGGNALEVDREMLHEAIEYTAQKFMENTSFYPNRISLYGTTKDILEQGKKGLTKLRWGDKFLTRFLSLYHPQGLGLIYWGVESGSNEVLKYINKGCTQEEIIEAAKMIRSVPLDGQNYSLNTSVMIMPGLGGEKFYDQHIRDTAKVLGKIQPKFITFMGVNPASNCQYSKIMKEEQTNGKNRPLTNKELTTQMIEIIERMPAFPTKIGCFDNTIDAVGYNPFNFGSRKIYSLYDKHHFVGFLKCLNEAELSINL